MDVTILSVDIIRAMLSPKWVSPQGAGIGGVRPSVVEEGPSAGGHTTKEKP